MLLGRVKGATVKVQHMFLHITRGSKACRHFILLSAVAYSLHKYPCNGNLQLGNGQGFQALLIWVGFLHICASFHPCLED